MCFVLALSRLCSAFWSSLYRMGRPPCQNRGLRKNRPPRKDRGLRQARGAGFLFFMAFVAVLAAVFLLARLENEARERTALRLEQSGVLLHSWLERTHHYAQGEQQAIMTDWARADSPGVTLLSTDELKASGYAPSWLAGNTTQGAYRVGLVPDSQGIPMAFALYRNSRPDPDTTPPGFWERMAWRAAGPNGRPALVVGRDDLSTTRIPVPQTLLERALGAPLEEGDLLVLADRHLDLNPDLLYRLPQPGHPELNSMETNLDLGGNSLAARALSAGEATLGEARAEALATQGNVTVTGQLQAESATAGSLFGTTLEVTGSLTAAELNVGRLAGQTLAVSESLTAGALVLEGTLTAPKVSTPQANASTGTAGQMVSFEIGRQGAGLPVTIERLETDGLYSSDLHLEGRLKITGSCSGC